MIDRILEYRRSPVGFCSIVPRARPSHNDLARRLRVAVGNRRALIDEPWNGKILGVAESWEEYEGETAGMSRRTTYGPVVQLQIRIRRQWS